jgi:DNA-directed RNA polymerase specialized sigma24 family protein
MQVCSVSPAVDSCARLIYQKAQKTYARIPTENRRYIDFEDVLQEGLIAAWKAEKTFDKRKKAKFSTYLFTGLDMVYSGLLSPLRQKKRCSNGMEELDAPAVSEISSDYTQQTAVYADILTDGVASSLTQQAAVSSLLAVFGVADPEVQYLLLEVASGNWRFNVRHSKLVRRLRRLSRWHHATEHDYNLLSDNADVKAQVIEGMSRLTNIEVADSRLLLCGECGKLFSLTDVRAGRYVASSLACAACLTKLQGEPVNSTCFGKRKVVQDGRTLRQGFSESNAACRLHCRDRVACKNYAARKGTHMIGDAAVLDDVQLEDVAVPAKTLKSAPAAKKVGDGKKKAGIKLVDKGTKKANKVLKGKTKKVAAKVAKVAKKGTAKKAKSKDEVVRKPRKQRSAAKIDPHSEKGKALVKANLDEKGRDLPYKNPSALRKLFVFALRPGRTLAELTAKAKTLDLKSGDPSFQLASLRACKSGDSSLRPYPSTHTWKLDEENGAFHIHGVKRIACYERMARIDGR